MTTTADDSGEGRTHPSSAGARRQALLAGEKILVVDDDDDARYLAAFVLEKAGARVSQADSVSAALAVLEAGDFTVLVSDLAMPLADGYELIRRVRGAAPASLRQLPAVALSAFCTAADRQKTQSAGFQAHIGKPFDATRLIETVRSVASPAQ